MRSSGRAGAGAAGQYRRFHHHGLWPVPRWPGAGVCVARASHHRAGALRQQGRSQCLHHPRSARRLRSSRAGAGIAGRRAGDTHGGDRRRCAGIHRVGRAAGRPRPAAGRPGPAVGGFPADLRWQHRPVQADSAYARRLHLFVPCQQRDLRHRPRQRVPGRAAGRTQLPDELAGVLRRAVCRCPRGAQPRPRPGRGVPADRPRTRDLLWPGAAAGVAVGAGGGDHRA
ncbi:hypothetical protein G6F59_015035 [Rhizopus arrhizus]|nr:hypothetical protein G6F59_015035 [Rhizopus arrhizus]